MFHYFLKFIGFFLFTFLWRLEVEGLENIPKKGKVILAGNHCSYLDPMVLFYICPRKFHAVVMKMMYDIWWLRWVFDLTGCIPTNGSSHGAVEALHQDKAVLIFPEGGCSHDGKIGKPRRGAAVLALKSGALVVPIVIKGTYEAWPVKQLTPTIFIKLKVRIGKPFSFDQVDLETIPEQLLDSSTSIIMGKIKELLL